MESSAKQRTGCQTFANCCALVLRAQSTPTWWSVGFGEAIEDGMQHQTLIAYLDWGRAKTLVVQITACICAQMVPTSPPC